eukprot:TRINITY_DN1090_c0_g1_i1.p1 TRINITY_DN1090_c0_g1~~TRINITY_DN1090_c0_g1_i1.p1  ORF type:complete len:485 (-),score=188.99 TRINITY_DN1090_c0_g1_i1:480-1934(-)
MKRIFLFGVILASILIIGSEGAAEKDGEVYVLTKSSFEEVITAHEVILVEFYAPWCGHCKKLEPEYKIAAAQLVKNDPPVALAKVDCTVETELQSRFGISGYPTLKIFRRGNPSDYNGPRDAAGIVSYMAKQAGPSAKPINNLDQLKKMTDASDIVVVGFFPESKTSAIATTFSGAADSLRDHFKFALIEDPNVAEEMKLGEGVTLLRNFDEKLVYGGSTSVGGLSEWVWEKSVPAVGIYSADTKERYTKKGLPVFKLFVDVGQKGSNAKQNNYYLNRLRKISQEPSLADKLAFVIADRKSFASEMTTFGLNSAKDASVAIDDFKKSLKYKFDGDFDVKKLTEFAKNWVNGNVEAWIKSEPVPAQQEDVKVVVGKTFNEIVLDDEKDVLIELYAPWCGHCKKLTPIYEELATKLKDVKNVVIAKMDATANDIPSPHYPAKGYPTIFLAPAGNKSKPIAFKGERTVEGFESFLKANTKSWLKDEL